MSPTNLRQRAAVMREVSLESVLTLRGAVRDRRDRRKWHSEQGPLSVSGSKFTNWRGGEGGGGAIDLVMHLAAADFLTALAWLEQHFGGADAHHATQHATHHSTPFDTADPPTRSLQLPTPDAGMLDRVRRYLTDRRCLSACLLAPLIDGGRIYADRRGNAVFLMMTGKPNRPVGAELRGTGSASWRGIAPGSRKDHGYFWIGAAASGHIILCESAIDAISCFQIHPQTVCISTAGARSNPPWLCGLLARGLNLSCGFDADRVGDATARAMTALHPSIERLRPPSKDWNSVLCARC